MKTTIPFLLIVFLVFLNACQSKPEELIVPEEKTPEPIELVNEWNKAHTIENSSVFTTLYGDNIRYYGSYFPNEEASKRKRNFLQKNPDYYQQIFGEIETIADKVDTTKMTCKFIKRVVYKGKTTDYPSYLVFKKIKDGWRIVEESDLVTDKNLSRNVVQNIPKDAIKGDFNGDGKTEFAWLIPPKLSNDEFSCVGECRGFIVFSDKRLEEIEVNDCIGGSPDNLGDLNQDGKDEIGILPMWFTSCWRGYHVWSLGKKGWYKPVEPITTHCDQWDQGIRPIEKDWRNNGSVIIRYSEHTGEEILVKSKRVPFRIN